MKKIFLSLCIAVLLFNIVSPIVLAANAEYDHEKLMEYDGYGKAMYETIVEETSFITGQYTENKEFVSDSIDQIKEYGSFFWNEQNWDSEPWTYDRFKEIIAKPAGFLLTVGDWVGKLFGDYGEKYHPSIPSSGAYDEFITPDPRCAESSNYCNSFRVNRGYILFVGDKKVTYGTGVGNLIMSGTINVEEQYADVVLFAWSYQSDWKKFYGNDAIKLKQLNNLHGDFTNFIVLASMFGVPVRIEKETGEPVKPITKPNPYDKFKNHVYDNISNVATPQPKPYLVCPNGSKIQMSIDGSTFLGVDGKAMIVNKDGTAQVDSAICKLGWDKPVVKYIDNRAAIETPDGKWKDAETGKMLDGDGGDGESECGMLCSLGKLAEFVLNFFEKLLEFFIKIFIPEDMDFISNEFDKLKNTFDDKLGIVGDLGGSIKSLFSQENPNPLQNLTISLPATGGEPIKVMEMSFIEQHVPTLKKVMSGILVLITVFYVYRKITGRGGVMEK